MAKIAVFNQKGGVGKTTTSLNLTAALARRGYNPLSIDLDPQAHLSYVSGATVERSDDSIFGFYQQAKPLTQLIRPATGGWLAISAHVELSKVDTHYGKGANVLNRLNLGILRENLNTGRPIVIDCCPVLGVLSLSAIFAADRVLIPVSADYLALKGVQQCEKTLKALEHVLKKRVARRYLVTRFDTRRKLSHRIAEELQARFGADICSTRIAENVALAESPASRKDVFAHAPESRGAQDYDALVEELLATGFIETRPRPVQ
ncbi:MAG: ParA family protein [Betaproteobacteria bacterium]|nr:ParA family protein [Betaproteobacteria bacterium]MDH4325291.1 ParA family protein [Betaproteobacteria bacterium]MDH5577365.1 ParA family protein [Betaproteobacteria bacterium]